ncbi:uncharacterized protein olf186-M isoform X2 [Chelonus insularis]|nr:uncharacterized protein LOC118072155 isoform X2 [Chelonus insularis]
MRRNSGPIQQWVNSIPSVIDKTAAETNIESNESLLSSSSHFKQVLTKAPTMTSYATKSAPNSPAITMSNISNLAGHNRLARDPSFQSDSSHCSSVESLLELRKPDPEAILIDLGFGGCSGNSQTDSPLSRIPRRFLQPSKLRGIAIEDFIKQQQATSESIDSTFLGYRGLTGSPYIAPSEIVQKIMQRLREHESHELETYPNNNSELYYQNISLPDGRFSVLSPDNREYLEEQRSKSPDTRKKRIIIGQKSFVFDGEGDLIEVKSRSTNDSTSNNNKNTDYPNNSIISSFELDTTNSDEVNDQLICNNLTEDKKEKRDTNLQGSTHIEETESSDSHSETESYLNEYSSMIDSKKEYSQENNNSTPDNFRQSKVIDNYLNENESPSEVIDNIRRTSNSCDSQTDSTIHNGNNVNQLNNEGIQMESERIAKKRRSLQRQARIDVPSSSTEFEDLNSIVDGINILDDEQMSASNIPDVELENPIKQKIHNQKRCDACRKSDELTKKGKHDTEVQDCCHHTYSPSCWRKMRKIMKKNEKLENMMARNRQEMAEIRDMLSNVLSVKMEPGF